MHAAGFSLWLTALSITLRGTDDVIEIGSSLLKLRKIKLVTFFETRCRWVARKQLATAEELKAANEAGFLFAEFDEFDCGRGATMLTVCLKYSMRDVVCYAISYNCLKLQYG